MYAYLKGTLASCTPTQAIIDVAGVGYALHISLHTYEKISKSKEAQLFTYLWVKDDALTLFGFAEAEEKAIFELMITVSGVGPNIARTVLSTLSPAEVVGAISTGNVPLLKSVKGIGAKTAQRMVLELQDKVLKDSNGSIQNMPAAQQHKEEAISALTMLGFARNAAEKALANVIKENAGEDLSVEKLIKLTLKAI
ncbi:Holliday junction branch migration protein RuvA [bacterium]|nr:Holliday junction branch migration protein RuvA [bacterium]